MHWYAWVLGPPETVLGFLITYPRFWRWVTSWEVVWEPSPRPVVNHHTPVTPFMVRCEDCGKLSSCASATVIDRRPHWRCVDCVNRGLPAKVRLWQELMSADEAKRAYVTELVHQGVATTEEAKRLLEM